MCGIAGFVAPHGQGAHDDTEDAREGSARRLRRMCDVIRHRGPDDEGMLVEPASALGMRRLSIIDLADGPSADSQRGRHRLGGLQRRDLQLPRAARGARPPRPRVLHATDTETIVHAYEEWGEDAFAQPARDVRHRALGSRARGRCCWRATASASSRCTTPSVGGRLYFGSEIKSLLVRAAQRRAL